MTEENITLADLLQKSGDGDFLKSVAETVLQILMETDVEGVIGAGRHERTAERLTYRNGYRDRALDTRLGTLQLRIPKLRQGSYFPPFPGAASDQREGIGGGDPGGVDRRRVDAEGRGAGAGDGSCRHLQEPGLEALQGHRRAGERLPGAAD
jgi:putative transposase